MSTVPATTTRDEQTRVIGLQTQFSADIIGLPIIDPRLTWQVHSSRPDAVQVAYEISSVDDSGKVTTSAVVNSADSVEIIATGHISKAQQIADIRVRIATQYGWSDYSPVARFETGLASGAALQGVAIGDDSNHSEPSPVLRK